MVVATLVCALVVGFGVILRANSDKESLRIGAGLEAIGAVGFVITFVYFLFAYHRPDSKPGITLRPSPWKILLSPVAVLVVLTAALITVFNPAEQKTETAAPLDLPAETTSDLAARQSHTDEKQVAEIRAKAAAGDAVAQFNLGIRYCEGQGVANDQKEAIKWFRKAAEQNHAGAQYRLGRCYYEGKGVTKDYVEAVKWFRKAGRTE